VEARPNRGVWLVLAAASSVAALVVLALTLQELSRPGFVCEGATFAAARLRQFELEKLALLALTVDLAAVICCLFARQTVERRWALLGMVVALGGALAFSALLSVLGWTPCLNT
jgi:hypothetical protein